MKYLLTILIVLSLSACFEPTPLPPTQQDAQSIVDSLVYVKSKGLCFGVIFTERINSAGNYSMSTVVVNVPCKD